MVGTDMAAGAGSWGAGDGGGSWQVGQGFQFRVPSSAQLFLWTAMLAMGLCGGGIPGLN